MYTYYTHWHDDVFNRRPFFVHRDAVIRIPEQGSRVSVTKSMFARVYTVYD